MLQQYQKDQKGDGFLSVKTFSREFHTGYDLLHLKSGKKCPFIRKVTHLEPDWQQSFVLADFFSFDKRGFEFAQKIVDTAILQRRAPFYFDEVGPLELKGKGFSDIFRKLVLARMDLIVAIRFFLVEDVKKTFSLNEIEIVNL